MSKKSLENSSYNSCTEKCRYRDHGKFITSAITIPSISDYHLACFINSVCKNYAQVLDHEGRTALHMAASCGRRDLCSWLLKVGKADFNCKDTESGYTPLHRSLFYGHINNAVSFIEMGAQLQVTDKEDLQASDLALKDRLFKELSCQNPCQVYVWGTNNNYTLGTGSQDSKAHPELVDFFRKNNISIKKAAIDKFHCVFVSATGRAWVCGHGQGGRLGVDSEQTVLKPQQIRTGGEVVVSAAVGTNHTMLLMESGTVWTCGSNAHHVLGHSPPPAFLLAPRPIPPHLLKAVGGQVVGVAAARYCSVLWTDSSVFTFGLNGGQLGHPQLQGKTVIIPKQVTGLNVKCKIVDVSASTGATVVLVSRGDIYLLYNYQTRRIASKILDVTKISVFGGELNAEVDQKLSAKGGKELKVMVLTSTGKVLLWQETSPQFTRCVYPSKRSLTFCGLSLSLSSVVFITKEGEAYLAHIKPKVKKKALVAKSKDKSVSFNDFIEKLECHHLSISKVAYVHRAVDVAADPKGQNFIVIQEHPNANLTDIPIIGESEFPQQMAALLENAHEDDSLHDILIEVNKYSVAAHHFILATSSEEFANMPQNGSVTTVKLQDVHIEVLNQVLRFAYTNDCQIVRPGPFHLPTFEGDVIKAAFELAKKWRMVVLMKHLSLLRYENGFIMLKEEGTAAELALPQRCWERSMLPTLQDVTVTSSDGATFKAHKCVLAARLEYFNSMFTGGWIEGSATRHLSIPVPQNILREVIDFLYKDESSSLIESQDVDYISSVLVVADQLFIKRLKEICEVALSGNISLRNTAYLLQFAITYNADQLKSCCMHFICLNIVAVIESRILEILDNKSLEELSRYYRNMVPAMAKRVMTPFSTALSEDEIIEIANSCPVNWSNLIEDSINDDESTGTKINRSNPTPIMNKKKPRARRNSEPQRKRFESNSSNSDLDCSTDFTSPEKIDFDDLVERSQTKEEEKEEWVTVDKTQKAVQDRLKAIVTAATIEKMPENFSRLGAPSTSPPYSYPSSPPLPHSIQDSKHFPQLAMTPSSMRLSSSPKSSSGTEGKRTPVAKLSQKQRKKLLAESEGKENVSEPVPIQSPWAAINNNSECSLADIMKSAFKDSSFPDSKKDQGQVKFSDIVAEEREQRVNWSKMKSKSLQLTQIEDKAMEELSLFYNVANTFDERITVERVISANIAKPTWITSRNQ